MNDPLVFESPCAICKVRKATRLCDFIIKYDRSIIFLRDYKQFKEVNAHGHDESCDLPLCEKCSHEKNRADLCPYHFKLQQQAELPGNLKKVQIRSKFKIAQESMYQL
jgi:hypothetical protein